MYEPTFESLSTRQIPKWFLDAKFGVFAHWTVGSVPSFAPTGKDPFTLAREEGEAKAFSHTPYAEWYWNSISIPGSPPAEHHAKVWGNCEYDVFVERFLEASQNWDPAHWQQVLAASGAKYCVMVTNSQPAATRSCRAWCTSSISSPMPRMRLDLVTSPVERACVMTSRERS